MHATPFARRATLAIPFLLAATAARSQPAAPPRGRVLLEVTGRLSAPHAGGVARFDLDMLDRLPQAGFSTRTPWMDGPQRFTGVAGAGLLEALGAGGVEVVASAINDYRVTIPVEDFRQSGLIIATRLNGETMPVREKGPLWVIYPFDAEARLRTEVFFGRSIWQLRRLEFRG